MDLPNRSRFVSMLDLILRVPPLFVMDSILNTPFSYHSPNPSLEPITIPINQTLDATKLQDEPGLFFATQEDNLLNKTQSLGWIFLCINGFFISFSMFLLSTSVLISIYLYLSSIGLVVWSYICNEEFMLYVKNTNPHIAFDLVSLNFSALPRFLGNYVLQIFLGILFFFAIPQNHQFVSVKFISLCFIAPPMLCVIPGLPQTILTWIPEACASLALLYLFILLIDRLKSLLSTIIRDVRWSRSIIRSYGPYTLLQTQWSRLQVPQVLTIFWITRFMEQALFMLADAAYQYYYEPGDEKNKSFPFEIGFLASMLKQLLIKGCETTVALLGMTSILSSITNQLGLLTQSFLQMNDPEDKSMGTVSAILFLILAFQTGLTGLEPEKRFIRLYRNICLMISAALHFIHNMVHPFLLSLSASKNQNFKKHSRAWLVCLFLTVFPAILLHFLWKYNPLTTWLLAVTFFQMELMLKVLITLLIYILFMIDSYRTTVWEKLDDYVYYIKATGNTIDFFFGILIFINGAWILLFESGGTIRALMVCLHAYFNIWQQAKAGWQTFMRRRSAVHKINTLREATREQLDKLDDICPICFQDFQELSTARITRCNHYFHELCLRKWLYVQDVCPLCHKTLYGQTENQENETSEGLSSEWVVVNQQQQQQQHSQPELQQQEQATEVN